MDAHLAISILICAAKVSAHLLQERCELKEFIEGEAVLARLIGHADHTAEHMVREHETSLLEGSRELIGFQPPAENVRSRGER